MDEFLGYEEVRGLPLSVEPPFKASCAKYWTWLPRLAIGDSHPRPPAIATTKHFKRISKGSNLTSWEAVCVFVYNS